MDKLKRHRRTRKILQFLNGIITNAHFSGFVSGRIYSGKLKQVCVPGMNCYSCPGALGACPIGAMQAVLGDRHPRFAFYVIGYLSVIGVLVGRFICGWLCLFGLIQELLYSIPTPKFTVPKKIDRVLRKMKYVFLLLFAMLLPLILRDELGISAPYFCKLVCPVGTLEGGIPLVLLDKSMRSAAHLLYAWKMLILILIVLASVFINRPFCKYICPLGAFYGLFHKIGFLKLECNHDTCISCGACSKTCNMQVDPTVNPNSAECIRCGECVKACPVSALEFEFLGKRRENQEYNSTDI